MSSRDTHAVEQSAAAPPDRIQGPWDKSHIDRLAILIADGRFDFPSDLNGLDRTNLEQAVRERLRERLLRFIACAIAHSSCADAPMTNEEQSDV